MATNTTLVVPAETPVAIVSGVDAAPLAARPAYGRLARRVLSAVVPAVAVCLVARHLGSSGATLRAIGHVDPIGLAGVVGLAVSVYVLSGIGLRAAAARPLRLGPTIGVQLAAAFANRVTVGGAGGVVTNVRYLERNGSTRAEAVSALSLQWIVRLVVHVLAIVAIVSLTHARLPFRPSMPDPPDGLVIAGAVVAAMAVTGLARWGIPYCRRLVAQAAAIAALVVEAAREPRRVLTLAACATGATAASTLGLLVALHAVGASASIGAVAMAYFGSSAAAALIPTPGGVGAVETALVAALVGLGVAAAPALAAVLVFRLVSYLLGLVPGAIAYRLMRAR